MIIVLSGMTPIQFDCSSQFSDDIIPSPHLSGTGHLTSVDEDVVLESSSDRTNSREKLASNLENATEELEAENKRWYERNEDLRKRHVRAEEEERERVLKFREHLRKLHSVLLGNEKKLHSYRRPLETIENSLKLESDLLRKDQEILTLRNESVDLSCGVCKLRNELDVKNRTDELKKSSEPQVKLAARLVLLETEFTELRRSKTPENDRVAEVVDGRRDSTGSTLLISDVNFELAVNSESTESFLEKPDKSEFVGVSQMDRNQLSKEQMKQNREWRTGMADRNGKFCEMLKTLEAESWSSKVNSELSVVFFSSSPFPVRLLPDKEGLLNLIDVSVIRENKTEILRLHDGLNGKVLVIKDFLNSDKVSMAIVDDERSGEVHTRAALRILAVDSKNTSGLPRLSKAERVKLSIFLSKCNRTTQNDGRSSGDGNDLCLLYDNLESKLSWLSCELLTKENESTNFYDLTLRLHCNCKISPELEENRKRLEGGLLSQAQDISRLESEICEFMESLTNLEDELGCYINREMHWTEARRGRKVRCT